MNVAAAYKRRLFAGLPYRDPELPAIIRIICWAVYLRLKWRSGYLSSRGFYPVNKDAETSCHLSNDVSRVQYTALVAQQQLVCLWLFRLLCTENEAVWHFEHSLLLLWGSHFLDCLCERVLMRACGIRLGVSSEVSRWQKRKEKLNFAWDFGKWKERVQKFIVISAQDVLATPRTSAFKYIKRVYYFWDKKIAVACKARFVEKWCVERLLACWRSFRHKYLEAVDSRGIWLQCVSARWTLGGCNWAFAACTENLIRYNGMNCSFVIIRLLLPSI